MAPDGTTGTETSPTGTARGREAKRLAAIAFMAAGLPYDEIIRRIGVSKRSLVRWNRDPTFAAEVRRARSDLLEQLTGRLAAEASSTVDVLVRLRDSAESEPTKLGACRALLERLLEVRDRVEVEQRLQRIEELLAGARPPAPAYPGAPPPFRTLLGGRATA